MNKKVSVVVATYNDDHRLNLALCGYVRQQDKDFEIIVVNDGAPRTPSEDPTRSLVNSFRGKLDIKYLYVEPESTDYRLPKALNLGLRHARGDLLIISDGDCIPHRNVVSMAKDLARDDRIVLGTRKRIPMPLVPYLAEHDFDILDNLVQGQDRRLWHPRYAPLFKSLKDTAPWGSWVLCWGCLLSGPLWKFKALGGFDEEFVGWGGDDEDMGERLVRAMDCKFLGLPEFFVYHLDHQDRQSHEYTKKLEAVRADWHPVRNGGPIP